MTIKQFLSDLGLAKDSPILGLAGATVVGIPLDTWVWMLGALYAVLRVIDITWTLYWRWQDRKLRNANAGK